MLFNFETRSFGTRAVASVAAGVLAAGAAFGSEQMVMPQLLPERQDVSANVFHHQEGKVKWLGIVIGGAVGVTLATGIFRESELAAHEAEEAAKANIVRRSGGYANGHLQ